jgi:hypothetical protein
VVPSYIFSYSLLRRDFAKARVEFVEDGVGYANRDEIRIIDLAKLNTFLKKPFKSVKELYFMGLSPQEEKGIKEALGMDYYDLSPLIVLDKISPKFEVYIYATTYKDVREKLLIKERNA